MHNALHRVPFLWTFHKVHHAITTMDFVGNFRFHWMEIVVYKSAQWLPLALLGASGEAAFVVAVFGTFWGDLNHANLNVGLGPARLRPQQPAHAPVAPRRLGRGRGREELRDRAQPLGLPVRDRLLAAGPQPAALGYPGIEEMPRGLVGELAWPLSARR